MVQKGSLPMRGEWIEIVLNGLTDYLLLGLSPCGESGLKLRGGQRHVQRLRSLPMRGEWIEIRAFLSSRPAPTVSPHAGRVD